MLGGRKAQLSCRYHSHPAGHVTWTKAKMDVTQDYSSISDSDAVQMTVNVSSDTKDNHYDKIGPKYNN